MASTAPLQRNGARNRHSNSKPAVAMSNGPVPKACIWPTAPGSCATHSTTPIIQSMPLPIGAQNTASKPNGSASTP